ncbi:hypothetical protein VZT92_019846 [Zoarces viviparus]|uniref:Secreted protein n=1 Tax=Zoarces viviparus TaxID=48416 RepID=A0AAW1EH98_ZOAVI
MQCIMGSGTRLCLPLIPSVSSQISAAYRETQKRLFCDERCDLHNRAAVTCSDHQRAPDPDMWMGVDAF